MDNTIGTCSLCGGPVTIPMQWAGIAPPIPQCRRCGATKQQPYGPTIPMTPRKEAKMGLERAAEEMDEPARNLRR